MSYLEDYDKKPNPVSFVKTAWLLRRMEHPKTEVPEDTARIRNWITKEK